MEFTLEAIALLLDANVGDSTNQTLKGRYMNASMLKDIKTLLSTPIYQSVSEGISDTLTDIIVREFRRLFARIFIIGFSAIVFILISVFIILKYL